MSNISSPKFIGFVSGLILFFFTLLTSPPGGLSSEAWHVAGVVLLMACWWATEAIPLPATALIPLALFPLLGIYDYPAKKHLQKLRLHMLIPMYFYF